MHTKPCIKGQRQTIDVWLRLAAQPCPRLSQVGLQLCSKDWRNRMDALRALQALSPALPEVPNAALEGLLLALVGRLADGNSKVNQKALEVCVCVRLSRE
jgi:hypothetical protein